MKRHRASLTSALLALSGALLLPTAASAKITELGALASGVHGSCPVSCQAVSRTTGHQGSVGTDRTLYRAPANGRIVAWSLSLGNPGRKQTAFFNKNFGGESMAALVVLKRGRRLARTVTRKAPMQTLSDYFGEVVQFPLIRTLPIRKGDYVGLSVPTWAPALQISLDNETSWRSSRSRDACLDTATQSAMLGNRTKVSFRCLYRTARLTYSATFVSNPRKPRN